MLIFMMIQMMTNCTFPLRFSQKKGDFEMRVRVSVCACVSTELFGGHDCGRVAASVSSMFMFHVFRRSLIFARPVPRRLDRGKHKIRENWINTFLTFPLHRLCSSLFVGSFLGTTRRESVPLMVGVCCVTCCCGVLLLFPWRCVCSVML